MNYIETIKEDGFAVSGFLILMPLLATLIAVSSAFYLIVRTDAKAHHLCRVGLLQNQGKVLEHLEALIALNPEAFRLRRDREEAEKTVAEATATGIGTVAASARLAYVIAAQTLLANKQKSIIFKARFESSVGPGRVTAKLQQGLSDDVAIYRQARGATNGHAGSVHTASFGKFLLDANPPFSLTPDYLPAANFSAAQRTQLIWSLIPSSLLPDWIRRLIPMRTLNLRAECSATIRKENLRWSAVLSTVKL